MSNPSTTATATATATRPRPPVSATLPEDGRLVRAIEIKASATRTVTVSHHAVDRRVGPDVVQQHFVQFVIRESGHIVNRWVSYRPNTGEKVAADFTRMIRDALANGSRVKVLSGEVEL